jgi:phage tail protein X
MASATDNCDPAPDVTYSDVTVASSTCPQEYTINRTWTATDACGNSSTCAQVITVDDSTAPVITTCPANRTIECDESTLPGNTGMASATDNCDPAPDVTYSDVTVASSTCPQEYTINRTWTATDACGNSSTCAQVITVDDSTAPVITNCPANRTIECDESTLPANTGMASATDNCDPAPDVTYSDVTVASSTCPQEYTINRTWTATDACGNSSTCAQVITVDDSTAPVITTCPANRTIECDESTLPGNTGMASATDNCDPAPDVTYSDVTVASSTCPQEYTINRTWTATDACGNSSTCAQVITVDDSTAPVITTCPANRTIECDESTLPGNTGMASATDNCDPAPDVTYSDVTVASSTCPQEYTINRTWTATDACGNSSTCAQVITVDDSTAPVITDCPANRTIECDESTLPGNTGMASATDNCDPAPDVTYSDVTVASMTCPQEYTINRTWTATDACGNSSTCTQVITVDDSTAPMMTCPDNITIECTAVTLPANTGMASATDNCDIAPVVTYSDITVASMSCPQEYTINRTWTATDACGNSSTCAQVITVDDSMPPMAICQNITVHLDENGMATITPEDIDNGSTDNCSDNLDLAIDISSFDCDDFTEEVQPIANGLIISEYVEGSSNNKAIEIYNGTGAAINLANSWL